MLLSLSIQELCNDLSKVTKHLKGFVPHYKPVHISLSVTSKKVLYKCSSLNTALVHDLDRALEGAFTTLHYYSISQGQYVSHLPQHLKMIPQSMFHENHMYMYIEHIIHTADSQEIEWKIHIQQCLYRTLVGFFVPTESVARGPGGGSTTDCNVVATAVAVELSLGKEIYVV